MPNTIRVDLEIDPNGQGAASIKTIVAEINRVGPATQAADRDSRGFFGDKRGALCL